MSSASAAQVVLDGLVKEKINLSESLKEARHYRNLATDSAETTRLDNDIADIRKELKELDEKIAKEKAELKVHLGTESKSTGTPRCRPVI